MEQNTGHYLVANKEGTPQFSFLQVLAHGSSSLAVLAEQLVNQPTHAPMVRIFPIDFVACHAHRETLVFRNVGAELEPTVFGLGTYDIEHPAHEHPHVAGRIVDIQFTRFDFRQVEHVVDERQEMAAAVLDSSQTLALRETEIGVAPEYLRVAQHAVEGSTQLVAHVGKELALR